MSVYTTTIKDVIIQLGYDNKMDYVFVQVFRNGEYLYSNITDENISFTLQTDFSHFDDEVKKLGLEIPEDLKIKTLNDRAFYLKSIEKIPNQILSYYNEDLIGAGDGRDFGVEIYQSIDRGYQEVLDYEFFSTESLALARVNQINGAFIDDVENL